MMDQGDLDDTQADKTPKPNEKEPKMQRSDPLLTDSVRVSSEIPEWLQDFRENLVDYEIPVHGDSHASTSYEASLEPIFKRREDLGKHSVHTRFLVKPYFVLNMLVT